jgi:hypothetical protein
MTKRKPKKPEPPVTPILDQETYEDILEWTPEEEEEFLRILEHSDLPSDDRNIN